MIKVPVPKPLATRGMTIKDYEQNLQFGTQPGAPVAYSTLTYPSFPLFQPKSGNNNGGIIIAPSGTNYTAELMLVNTADLSDCGIVEFVLMGEYLFLSPSSNGGHTTPHTMYMLFSKVLPGSGTKLGESSSKFDEIHGEEVHSDGLYGTLKHDRETHNGTGNIDLDETYVEANPTSGSITLHLPDPRDCEGKEITVKKVTSSYTVTIDVASGDQIDGNSSVSLTSLYETYVFFSRYGSWGIKAHYSP